MTRRGASAVTLAAVAVALSALARGLPADTFYTGDPGVKLIAARNATSGSSPLEIPLPRIGGDPVPYVDPFFAPHDDHSHAVAPELFPLVTAPFLAAFGLRGLYILPAIGLLSAVAGAAWLAVLLDQRRRPAVVMLTALLGTPLPFYGLEFWEHAPATGMAVLATCLLVQSARRGLLVASAAGVMFGMAILLRPEAIWIAVAAAAAARSLPARPGVAQAAAIAGGVVLALTPLLTYSLLHFGSPLTPHLAGNPALWEGDWLARRADILESWLLVPGPANAWITVPALVVSLVPLPRRFDRGGRRFLIALAGVTMALTLLTAPNDGGGQWGPRYLLPAFVPLAILAADVLEMLVSTRGRTGVMVVAALCATALFVQRMSYQRLRGTKETYGRVLAFVRDAVPRDGYIVTDLWWLDQVAAAAADDRVFLYAPDDTVGQSILRRMDEAAIEPVALVSSNEESVADPGTWMAGTCYRVTERQEVPVRSLAALRLERDCL